MNLMCNLMVLTLFLALLAFPGQAKAQVESQVDTTQFVESQLDKEDQTIDAAKSEQRAREKIDYSQVKETTPYSDMVTIQKTMLPKSERFRFMGGLTLMPNDVFFTTFGVDGRFGYDFNETWGVETEALFLTSRKGEDLKGLENTQRVRIDSLSSLKSFWGASVLFTPFYGKTALFNNKIIPFEIYQTLGVGKVDAGNSNQVMAFKAGAGELFSWNKNRACRLELSLLFYKSKTILNTDQSSNVLLLTIGIDNFITKVGDR